MNDASPSLVDLYNLKQEYGVDNHYSVSDSNVTVTSNSGEVVNTLSVSDIPSSTTSYESTESTGNTGNGSTTNTGDNLRDRGYSSSMDGYNPSKSNGKESTTPNVVKPSQLNKGEETDSGTGNAEAGAKAGILASDITNYEEPALSYDARIDENHDNSAYWSEHREEQRRMEAAASLERIEELKTIAEGKQKAADEQAEKFKVCGNTIGSDTEPDDNSVDLRDPNYNELDSTEKSYGEVAAATQAYLTAIEKYKQEYGDLNLETDLDIKQQEAQEQLDAAVDKQYKVRNTSAMMEEINYNLTQLFGGSEVNQDEDKELALDGTSGDEKPDAANNKPEEKMMAIEAAIEAQEKGRKLTEELKPEKAPSEMTDQELLELAESLGIGYQEPMFKGYYSDLSQEQCFEMATLLNQQVDAFDSKCKDLIDEIENAKVSAGQEMYSFIDENGNEVVTGATWTDARDNGLITREEYQAHIDETIANLETEYIDNSQNLALYQELYRSAFEVGYEKYAEYEDFDENSKSIITGMKWVSSDTDAITTYPIDNKEEIQALIDMGLVDYNDETQMGIAKLQGYFQFESNGEIINPSDVEIAKYLNENGISLPANLETEFPPEYSDDQKYSIDGSNQYKYDHLFENATADELAIITYLSNTGSDKLAEYVDYEMDVAEQRFGAKQFINEYYDDIKSYYDKVDNVTITETDPVTGEIIGERKYTAEDAYRETIAKIGLGSLKDGIEKAFAGFDNLVNADGKKSAEEYKSQYLVQFLNNAYGDTDSFKDEFSTAIYELGTSIGNMLPSIAIGAIAGPIAGTAFMGVSAAGNYMEEGLQNNMTKDEAALYGALAGFSEAALQYFLGGIATLGQGDLSSAIANYTGMSKFLAEMISEGIEESTQSILNPFMKYMVTGGKIKEEINWEEVAKSGFYGMITAGILNGGTIAINGTTYLINTEFTGIIDAFNNTDMLENIKKAEELGLITPTTEPILEGQNVLNIDINESPKNNIVTKIDNMLTKNNGEFSIEEFLQIMTEQYGSDGLTRAALYAIMGDTAYIGQNLDGLDIDKYRADIANYLANGEYSDTFQQAAAARIGKNNDFNGYQLKDEIMVTLEGYQNLTDLEIARKLYLELNKRVHYNPNWTYGDSQTQNALINGETSFANLDSDQLICKDWSSLYADLLVSAGIDPEKVKIMEVGNGKHYWVEMELTDGEILIADATDGLGGGNDIALSKFTNRTPGFLVTDASNTGKRIYNMLTDYEIEPSVRDEKNAIIDSSLDNEIGTAFSDVAVEFGQDPVEVLNNLEFPDNFDGMEAWIYVRKTMQNLRGNMAGISIDFNEHINSEGKREYQFYYQSPDVVYTYSKSEGKRIMDPNNPYSLLD